MKNSFALNRATSYVVPKPTVGEGPFNFELGKKARRGTTITYHTIPTVSSVRSTVQSCFFFTCSSRSWVLRWGFSFFGWGSWLISLRFVFGDLSAGASTGLACLCWLPAHAPLLPLSVAFQFQDSSLYTVVSRALRHVEQQGQCVPADVDSRLGRT